MSDNTTNSITREEWLIHAVTELDENLFMGSLNVQNHPFQIACSKCEKSNRTTTVQPHEELNVTDYFPTTITIDYKLSSTKDVLLRLARECITAFMGDPKGKKLKSICKQYGFESPYKEAHAGSSLNDLLDIICTRIKNKYGEFPNIPVVDPPKKETHHTPKYICFCPDCGFQFIITKNAFQKYGSKIPICGCGKTMELKDKYPTSNDEIGEEVQ